MTAPEARRWLTISKKPLFDAKINGVSPYLFLALTSATFINKDPDCSGLTLLRCNHQWSGS